MFTGAGRGLLIWLNLYWLAHGKNLRCALLYSMGMPIGSSLHIPFSKGFRLHPGGRGGVPAVTGHLSALEGPGRMVGSWFIVLTPPCEAGRTTNGPFPR